MGSVSRHARTGGEEKKRGGREEVSIDPIVLTQLWLLNVVKKDRGVQNFRVLEYYYVVLLLTADCYLLKPNPPELREPTKLPIPFQQILTRAMRVPYLKAPDTVQYTNKTLPRHTQQGKGKER